MNAVHTHVYAIRADTPFLAVRDEFHPKRNQARQKLATLPKNRFKDLSSDVFFELERRFPELRDEFRPEAAAREREAKEREERQREAERARLEAGRSLSPEAIRGPSGSTGSIASRSDIVAQPSTPDLIIPAKSTLVEEEIEVPYANKTNGKTSPPYVRSKGRASDYTDGEAGSGRESVGSISAGAPDNRSTMFSQASSVGTGFFNGYAGSASQSVASPRLGREVRLILIVCNRAGK